METLTDPEVAELLPWPALIEGIERVLVDRRANMAARTVHTVPVPGGVDASFLLAPGWIAGEIIGVKAVTVFPDNGVRGLPTVQSAFLLFDATNGSLRGACEADVLTTRRTAAASAVAAKRLARLDVRRLLVIGSGALAPMAARAHAAVRPYEAIEIWGRDPAKAAAVAAELAAEGLPAVAVADLARATASADVISSATGATEPLIAGSDLQPGVHVDLVGGFNAAMRESDDDVVRRGTVFVDSREGAVLAGDLAGPLADGVISVDDIAADLAELVAGTHGGRRDAAEITVFKSVGIALEDLAAARLAFATDPRD